jgi:hypothetical protein
MASRLILILVFALFLVSCNRQGRIDLVTSSTPLTFKIVGGGDVQWIWIQGPFENESEPGPELRADSDPKKIILWKIRPHAHEGIMYDVPVNRIPDITYGRLLEGWDQEIPQEGSPPRLIDGHVYYIGVVSARAGSELCVFLKNGQLHPYEDGGEDGHCDGQ